MLTKATTFHHGVESFRGLSEFPGCQGRTKFLENTKKKHKEPIQAHLFIGGKSSNFQFYLIPWLPQSLVPATQVIIKFTAEKTN